MLALNYSTSFDGVAERIINGKLAPEPVWECTDIPEESLPFMQGDGVIAPAGIPWEDITVHWFPDRKWAISK